MKFKIKDLGGRWKSYTLAGCICVALYVCLMNLGKVCSVVLGFLNVFKPLLFGFVIAYIINPLAVFFDKSAFAFIKGKKLRWVISATVSLIIVLSLITVIIASFMPQMIDSIASLIENADTYIVNVKEFTAEMKGPVKEIIDKSLEELGGSDGVLSRVGTVITDNIGKIVEATSNFGSKAAEWAIGVILAVYFLMAKESFLAGFKRLFYLTMKDETFKRSGTLAQKFNAIFSKYIMCQLIDTGIIGGANYLFMILLGMPNALVVSVIVGVTNLVPTFGPVIGGVVGAFILLLVDPSSVLPFLVFTIVIQCMDSYVIKPKLFGDALSVPGVLILVSIIVFGRLMGVVGMLLAIPFAAILVYMYENMIIPGLEIKKKEQAAQ